MAVWNETLVSIQLTRPDEEGLSVNNSRPTYLGRGNLDHTYLYGSRGIRRYQSSAWCALLIVHLIIFNSNLNVVPPVFIKLSRSVNLFQWVQCCITCRYRTFPIPAEDNYVSTYHAINIFENLFSQTFLNLSINTSIKTFLRRGWDWFKKSGFLPPALHALKCWTARSDAFVRARRTFKRDNLEN